MVIILRTESMCLHLSFIVLAALRLIFFFILSTEFIEFSVTVNKNNSVSYAKNEWMFHESTCYWLTPPTFHQSISSTLYCWHVAVLYELKRVILYVNVDGSLTLCAWWVCDFYCFDSQWPISRITSHNSVNTHESW